MLAWIAARQEWQFFRVLPRAHRGLALSWWAAALLRGILPAVLAIALGMIVGAVQSGDSLTGPLIVLGAVFIALQVLTPIHQALSSNLGDRTAALLYDRLTAACVDPPGMGHLEDASLAADLTVARDFDLGITGPPLFIAMDFIAVGVIQIITGAVSIVLLFGYTWWAPPLLAVAWVSTHYLLRESSVWRDRQTEQVQSAQRESDYAYRMAVDPPAAKEVRMFGLSGWVLERFLERRVLLHKLQYEATRLREQPVVWSLLIVVAANAIFFAVLGRDASQGRLSLESAVIYAQLAVSSSLLAFGGLNWALDGAAAPVAASLRLTNKMARAGDLPRGAVSAAGLPASEIRFRDVSFQYPTGGGLVLDHFDLAIPAGSSLAIVGQNGAGKTTLAKLLCRLYDPQSGAIEVDGTDLRQFDLDAWRSRVAAVFQDYVRFEWPLRDNVAPTRADDAQVLAALREAGATNLASLDTVLSKGYANGTDLSGGQWQRVALARALCKVELGAGVVLLDEPTAQLDVRGEAEIFRRILEATRDCTTILISHRFSTVRHADRICVVEGGRVIELGTHDELMALRGRYRTMFDLQAQRFVSDEEQGMVFDVLA